MEYVEGGNFDGLGNKHQICRYFPIKIFSYMVVCFTGKKIQADQDLDSVFFSSKRCVLMFWPAVSDLRHLQEHAMLGGAMHWVRLTVSVDFFKVVCQANQLQEGVGQSCNGVCVFVCVFVRVCVCVCVQCILWAMFFAAAVLAENNRLQKVSPVIKAYGTIMTAYRGEVACVVTSAQVSSMYTIHVYMCRCM